MTHTQGPWKFKTDSITGDCGIAAEGTGVFAEAFADIRHAGEGNRAEALANAKLIAAAPDLFEALKLVMTWVKNWDPNFTEDEEWFEDRVKIDAAIAKAS